MKVEKIKVDQASLARLMVDMREGRLRVPRFQRDFVWERKRIQELLDSMYKEYPIGTIFLWEAPHKYNHLLRNVEYLQQPAIEAGRNYSLIVDGQQRLTSLYVAVHGLSTEGEDYRKIVVDLSPRDSENIFQYREPDNKRWVSIRDLLNGDFVIYNGLPSDEHRARFVRCNELLRNYPFSVVVVREMDIENAVEIFERINRAGRPLSRYDLITASVLDDDFDLRERTQYDIIEPLAASGFGHIEETSIPQSLALNIRGRTESAAQMELTKEDVKPVWQPTVECFMAAVGYVRQNLGALRVDFLPYDGIIPILAYYFYISNSRVISGKHREQIERWYWRVAFSERYSGASQTRMTEDANWLRELIEIGSSYEKPITTTVSSLIEGSMSYTTSAVRNGVLCLLNLQAPMHFRNATRIAIGGDYFSKFNVAERNHIFPVGFLKKSGHRTEDVHKIPNFAFLPEDLSKWIGDRPPSQYMLDIRNELGVDLFEKVMRSHLIPIGDNSGIWNDNYERFLMKRSEMIIGEVMRRCGISDGISEEKRNPIIDSVEHGLRDKIHEALSNLYGLEYWNKKVSKNIADKVEERIEQHIRKSPGLSKQQFANARERLAFCTIFEYHKIITDNWTDFSSTFRSTSELQRNLEDFNDFRNAVKHSRPIDVLLEYKAKASIIWLSRALNLDLTGYDVLV